MTGLREIEKMRQPHQEFENSRSKCEKAAPNPADYLGEIPLDYRDGQQQFLDKMTEWKWSEEGMSKAPQLVNAVIRFKRCAEVIYGSYFSLNKAENAP